MGFYENHLYLICWVILYELDQTLQALTLSLSRSLKEILTVLDLT
jgi:hypothetical protein